MTVVAILSLLGCASLHTSSISNIESALKSETRLLMEDVQLNKFENIPEGYIAKYRVTSFGGDEHIVEDRFIGEKDGGFLFKTFIDGKQFLNDVKMLKNGRIYSSVNGIDFKLKSSFENCDKYYVGECITKNSKTRTRNYSKGIWTNKYKSLGLTWIAIRTVYDKYGLTLYRENINTNIASPSKNGRSTTIRIM